MASEKPEPAVTDDIEPPPPEPEPEPAPAADKAPAAPKEDVWAEDYEEHIDAEEPPISKPKKAKPRRYGAAVVLVIVIVFLILWTVLSPRVLPQAGDLYMRSARYANLTGNSVDVDTYAGNATWAVSVSLMGGSDHAVPGEHINVTVLLTKVSETPSNFWFIGFGVQLKNVSILDENGSFLAKMTNSSDFGFGPIVTISLTVPQNQPDYSRWNLIAYLRFLMFTDMRIGYLPVLDVEINPVSFFIYIE